MSGRINVLAQQLCNKASIEDCTLEEIESILKKYPYFAPAQFLLLKKLKQNNPEKYQAQLKRAVLYYHDPLQFEYFINSDRFYTDISLDDKEKEEFVQSERERDHDNLQMSLPEVEETTDTQSPLVKESGSISEIASGTPQKEKDLLFEPYHTVDYFASQGIKGTSDDAPKDKLGKQLKSFTEWLKTMKRLPAADISKNVDVSAEKKVEHLATDSVHESNVVTEAMADVWLKQGNKEKAIEIYNKLSLLNPAKKAFFAAKIQDLKNS